MSSYIEKLKEQRGLTGTELLDGKVERSFLEWFSETGPGGVPPETKNFVYLDRTTVNRPFLYLNGDPEFTTPLILRYKVNENDWSDQISSDQIIKAPLEEGLNEVLVLVYDQVSGTWPPYMNADVITVSYDPAATIPVEEMELLRMWNELWCPGRLYGKTNNVIIDSTQLVSGLSVNLLLKTSITYPEWSYQKPIILNQ